ncbi:spore coat protein [Candidatus Roizmanbacteria bacterium CG02_land_8_20_14_3_00_36_15]|uniref:glucose-1-phosphate thymidylyltransferase n=3 Tax=Candidatus Roizmaniibacteriota TaxID=1752723 RepID=A0A2H0BYL8_9BACT|nr:MAG: spore coat protein [Candidatus Roizmanbacteria bacterium CG22_combo_CG10-13_8_21_14_all_35_9]PIV09560.1 MAG: spore coat protein [Candidatus Roizmanbacteria bacterium CG03_land_8_20_14_0_80_36_21]PIV37342.1 MAG: spore coat protein [Candidatus Roizmanbacteria bacterium CG02_land_8_20_14_3_00_36_15]PJA53171.1 MAG: spore coat protein [Candidatus Roizmanbacteria bacterium CG_4_9_14_3_um_filter_36_11]PJC81515.1 MAG: spore coat protein [Candidatus Roizmanbacteria bacterium CG_4_8_14_3_um_filte
MKGVVIAGGLATRLFPLTHATNKHLLPVYDKPMIFYPIQTLVQAGIKDILIIVSGPHAGHFIPVLKNGTDFGINHLEFAYQEKPDGGIADALALAEDFADNRPIVAILGDNTTDAKISTVVKEFKDGAVVFLKKVPDPHRFGVPRFDKKDHKRIVEIMEKPKKASSPYAVTGVYIYDEKVFDYIRKCKPSARGQLEITDVNNLYIKNNKLKWSELKGYWLDAGTCDTLTLANLYWAKKRGSRFFKRIIKEIAWGF